eukprot:GHVT01065841.1.p1 GENE.GHVT01065841.1~~GHVT01065841.1.p1  ORF type:complete len:230 (+),score=41.21 GHVT01065841.1:1330-2019(+)
MSTALSRFQTVQEAYTVLGSPWKRRLYDRKRQGDATTGYDGIHEPQATHSGDDATTGMTTDESDHAREQRRAHYRRYAAGLRTDVPDATQHVSVRSWVHAVLLTFVSVVAMCIVPPGMVQEEEDEESSHGSSFTADDMRGCLLVRSYFNPISRGWERLAEGYDPPTPQELTKHYYEEYPSLARLGGLNVDILPTLTVAKIPVYQTTPAILVKNATTGRTEWAADHTPTV